MSPLVPVRLSWPFRKEDFAATSLRTQFSLPGAMLVKFECSFSRKFSLFCEAVINLASCEPGPLVCLALRACRTAAALATALALRLNTEMRFIESSSLEGSSMKPSLKITTLLLYAGAFWVSLVSRRAVYVATPFACSFSRRFPYLESESFFFD